jgi:ribosome biogenesis GTPase / thiamine phosphate phosphatase
LKSGVVIKSTGSHYRILCDDGSVKECVIRGNFRVKGIRTTNPVAVGDIVHIDPAKMLITSLVPRRNYMIRRASNLSKESQIIAANIDQVILMISMIMPETPVEFIDRFLATAEAYRIPAILLVNKSDLISEELKENTRRLMTAYEKIGYKTILVSVKESNGLEELNDMLTGKTTLVAGNSGVGKSSLLNYLNPSLNLKTDDISLYHEQGKHITTFPEMHIMPSGARVIDSPGIRGFGVIDFDRKEIYHFFPEIFRVSSGCRFHNCLHLSEPGCAVREAVESGEIELWRFKSYLSMLLEDDLKYR